MVRSSRAYTSSVDTTWHYDYSRQSAEAAWARDRLGYTSIWKDVSLVSRVGLEPILPLEERRPSFMSHSASLSSREWDLESENLEGGWIRSLKLEHTLRGVRISAVLQPLNKRYQRDFSSLTRLLSMLGKLAYTVFIICTIPRRRAWAQNRWCIRTIKYKRLKFFFKCLNNIRYIYIWSIFINN